MELRLRPEARLDLEAAARWYEAQEQGLGRQFLDEVRLTFERIRANPEAYRYGVIDLPVAATGISVVLAVLHCGRDPKLWRERSRP
ncbi:type II toxin-antitoxin system RelE/ParE family toxin [Cyanobium sp. CH-040]|uniref:type II toxin-antitoxin system RelE/ParE family toxin n=1 Tax=Cyanobium sp. CH-040 TaxID=2823708 RepID=UPI0020CD8AD8|nr:type II toxin-antitoxin system RelE/ParE family toxin [Cyanobium sp. CH-040]MCP9927426.1 type II toxin-antitoxin system RelE/ParE family toxin [Cyanobium sp. CH-040]